MRRRPLKIFRIARRPALAGLAFLAMLLLLAMPTAGRLLGAPGMAHVMAMAGTAPATMPDHSPAPGHVDHGGHAEHPAMPDGNGGHPDDGNCPYCPLLGSVVALAPCVVWLAVPPEHRPAPLARRIALIAAPRHSLGARGPPALL